MLIVSKLSEMSRRVFSREESEYSEPKLRDEYKHIVDTRGGMHSIGPQEKREESKNLS